MAVPTSGNFDMFGTGTTTTIAGAIVEGGGDVSGLTTFDQLIAVSTTSKFDATYAGTISSLSDVSASLQYRNYPIVTVVYYSCGTTVTNTTNSLTTGTYPTVFVNPTDTAASRTLNWNTEGVNRPNKYELYANGVFVASTGWKGTAAYSGPWGNFSLNTAGTGTLSFTWPSTVNREVRVEYGNADPNPPSYTDASSWSINC